MNNRIWLTRLGVLLLVFSVWLGSVWMFFIQPLVGKIILPKFGADPEAWNTALNAFAIASVPGLLCAWLLTSLHQKRWAIGAVTTAFILLLFYLSTDSRHQQLSLVENLLPFCGAMCLLFMIQVILPFWFGQAATPAWVDPYFVLAFAHLGAMMALISYPLLVEPYLPATYQHLAWLIGFAVIGLLFLICAWLVGLASDVYSAEDQPVSGPGDCPTWLRRFRWSVLGGIPTVLLTQGPPPPDPLANLHLIIIFELTLVVAYVRLPRGKPSRLSWGVQILGVLTCLPSLMLVSESLSGPDGKLIYAMALCGVLASALVPHRWTLTLQGVMCVTVLVWSATGVHTPVHVIYIIHLAAVAVTGWGCYGDMVGDRPGPERLAEFLFFTGLAPSIVFVFVPVVIPLLTPRVAYPGIVLLALLARFLPGKNARRQNKTHEPAHPTEIADEIQPVIDTSIRDSSRGI